MRHSVRMILGHFLLVGLGGALGTMMRHGVGLFTLRYIGTGFPWNTLAVNIFGSLAIGIIIGALAHITTWSQEIRLFAVVGVLGGFTTFSSFSLDTILLFERGQVMTALSYVVASVVLSVLAAFGGLGIMRMVAG